MLAKLAVDDAVLPLVYHGMPESYYKLLLRMGGPRDAKELLALLEGAPNPKMLSDQLFAQLLPAVEAVGNMQDADGLPQNLPAMLDMPRDAAAVQEDVARVHRMAAQVLRAIPADMIDFRSTMACSDGGFPVQAHFDNCSHSTGKQRGYVACPVAWHSACFKYTIVDKFESHKHAAAWLTAWARHAVSQTPDIFSKTDHGKFNPADEVWQPLVQHMHETRGSAS